MANLYKGTDRRLLAKMRKVLDLIEARDTRVDNPARTSAISNRVKIIDSANSSLVASVAAVSEVVDAKLAATA